MFLRFLPIRPFASPRVVFGLNFLRLSSYPCRPAYTLPGKGPHYRRFAANITEVPPEDLQHLALRPVTGGSAVGASLRRLAFLPTRNAILPSLSCLLPFF